VGVIRFIPKGAASVGALGFIVEVGVSKRGRVRAATSPNLKHSAEFGSNLFVARKRDCFMQVVKV
jgi:hypothetical protein